MSQEHAVTKCSVSSGNFKPIFFTPSQSEVACSVHCKISSVSSNLFYRVDKLASLEGLKIAQLNIRRLIPKRDQIELLLQQTHFHILLINESWLNNDVSDTEINIPGYNIVRNDRTRTGGGVLAYVCQNLKFVHLCEFQIDSVESLWVKITLG